MAVPLVPVRSDSRPSASAAQARRGARWPRKTFEAMLEVLEQGEAEKRKPGRPSKLTLPDQLLLTLSYWREYRTLFHIGADYGVHESNAQRIVTRVEKRLIGSARFALSPRETLLEEGSRVAVVVLDAAESPVERPKKKQRQYYSGKKKRHTNKAQLLIESGSGLILSSAFASGRTHDLRLCREHRPCWTPETICLADSGYQGLGKMHARTLVPYKAKRGQSLDDFQKRYNRALARVRIQVEHVIGALKRFRILAERYRNRRRRFGLRFNLIAGLYNHALALRLG